MATEIRLGERKQAMANLLAFSAPAMDIDLAEEIASKLSEAACKALHKAVKEYGDDRVRKFCRTYKGQPVRVIAQVVNEMADLKLPGE